MKGSIITIILTVTSLTMVAQDRLILVDNQSEDWQSPKLSLFHKEIARLLVPQNTEIGMVCVPSFHQEQALTYDSVTHALVVKIVEKSIWSTISEATQKKTQYLAPGVKTYSLAINDQQARILKGIWTYSINNAENKEVNILDGTKWKFFIGGKKAKTHNPNNPLVKFSNELMDAIVRGDANKKDSLFDVDAKNLVPNPPRRRFQMDARHPDVHDPVMAKGEDGRFYIFSTGMNVGVMSSADMKEWKMEKPALEQTPAWAIDTVRGYRGHTWAPDISYHNNLWHLYYSCSTFGKNGSAIGLAVNKSLDPNSPDFKWVDKGMVIASHRRLDNYNAIDPNLIVDEKGQPYLAFGSFWDGIQMVRLSKEDFQTPIEKPFTISRRVGKKLTMAELNDVETFTIEGNDTIEAGENAVEAPFIFSHGGYYYLFVSFDYCCRGEKSTYKTVYGRSKNVTGPYLDRQGQPMEKGGGTLLFGPNDEFFGVGHCAVYDIDGQCFFLSHAYEKAQQGRAKLFLRPIRFDNEGWIAEGQ